MDWFVQIIAFGLLAFLFFVLSAASGSKHKFGCGVFFGFLELLCAVISSSAWAWALKVSGKGDWFLLGILGYTPVVLICYAMFVVGAWCTVTNIRGISKQKTAAHSAEKA